MRTFIIAFFLFLFLALNSRLCAQLSKADTMSLVKTASIILKPELHYRYNLHSDYATQTVVKRTNNFNNTIIPSDTMELKQKLKNNLSDATVCFKLYNLYKNIYNYKSSRFYLHKSIFWFQEILKTNPLDSAAVMNLSILYSEDHDYDGMKAAYKILAQVLSEKEQPYTMLCMLYMSKPDSVDYFLSQYNQKIKDSYKKMVLVATVKALQNAIHVNPKDSTNFRNKDYTAFTDWTIIEGIYKENKNKPEYQLVYHSIKTYLIGIQFTIFGSEVLKRYESDLKELEAYYLDCIKSKVYTNKLLPYLSLSAVYTFQKKYDLALSAHDKAYKWMKEYRVTDQNESEEIIDSYLKLFDLAHRYKEGADFIKKLIHENEYNLYYRKVYIYFLYQSEFSNEINIQASKIDFYNHADLYPQLVYAYEALKNHHYDAMYKELTNAYAKNSSAPEVFAFMAVLNILHGNYPEAKKNIADIKPSMPSMAEKLSQFMK
ncbi:MAG TPA: hypothetical protein VK766_08305 [Cytophagaceae bacterium]|jgi:hypothetical protein|nr:hypothetical protein [Cytophagaceae bacterium]